MSDGERRTDSEALNAMLSEISRRLSAGVRPGLEVIQSLLHELGNPHRTLAVIHVAGTNGKGSVCALLESMLRHAGIKTGLYTSPHLVRLHERFRVNGEEMDDAALCTYLEQMLQADARRCTVPGNRPATFFELTTALAFQYFADAGVDLVVLETGMGGRWDATNVIIPLVSVITNVTFDHVAFLGSTLETIAGEKCGILKKGRPAVVGGLVGEALSVLQREAGALGVPVIHAEELISIRRLRETAEGQVLHVESGRMAYGKLTLPLKGDHQIENLAVALAALEETSEVIGWTFDVKKVRKGIAEVHWRGRYECLSEHPRVILDGAHNVAGVESLAATLRHEKVGCIGLVCGFLADKDTHRMTERLASVADTCWTVPVDSPRSMNHEELAEQFRSFRVTSEPCENPKQALEKAMSWARKENGTVVVTGSLYLIGEVLGGWKS
ncbi:MAG: bifunctional folylpolyglutamate synthase/dihydrofolate synthase [Kiritimatiellae bacterium]|nr:bifunctional folylpolyglutamate synthase/dihydrofolate synthase [Kiritimatiellia bacterium]